MYRTQYVSEQPSGAAVHKGFLTRFEQIAASADYKEKVLQFKPPAGSVLIFTGHSLGGAVAILAALTYKLRLVDEQKLL